jgi:hypothetical protein
MVPLTSYASARHLQSWMDGTRATNASWSKCDVKRRQSLTAATISAAVAQRLTTSANVSRRRKWNCEQTHDVTGVISSLTSVGHNLRQVVTKMAFYDHWWRIWLSKFTMPPFDSIVSSFMIWRATLHYYVRRTRASLGKWRRLTTSLSDWCRQPESEV